MSFTDDDRKLLDLEARRWRSLGEKDAARRAAVAALPVPVPLELAA